MGKKWNNFKAWVQGIRGWLCILSWVITILTLLAVVGVVGYQYLYGDLAADDELLIEFVGGSKNSDRRGDVVFIHGLDGHYQKTWQSDSAPPFDFPVELSKDPALADVGFWSIKYAASSSDWYGSSMPIEDRGITILTDFRTSRLDIGKRPIVFVTHSLGGLIAKEVLVDSAYMNQPDWECVVENTAGVVFLATPHTGSSISNYLTNLAKVLPALGAYRTSQQTKQLEKNSASLRKLVNFYKGIVRKYHIPNLAFYENKATNGVFVVDQASADPGLSEIVVRQ